MLGFGQQSVGQQGARREPPMGVFIQQVVATSLGLDVVRNSVSYLLYASLVMIAISVLGALLACCPPSRMRALLTFVYLVLGLPSWVLHVFVSVTALSLRDDAERLVQQYWKCLQKLSPTGVTNAPDAYRHADAAAWILITNTTLLLLSLLAACRAIGWRALARHSIMCISLVSGLVGAVTLAVGVVLRSTSNIEHRFFDGAVMGLGGCVFVVSLVGIVASKNESRCLLRTYAGALLLLVLAIFAMVIYLLIDGTSAVQVWLEHNWNQLSEHVCTSAISLCFAGMMSKDEFATAASSHLLAITTMLVLLFLVLLVDLLMACVLQCLVTRRAMLDEAAVEMESLVVRGDDDDDDDER